MQGNSCQGLLSWKQRQRARDFWQTPFPCAQKHRALSLLLTRAVNSWKITQTCLYASLHKSHDSPSERKGRWGSSDQEEAGDSGFFHRLAMREENQIKHLENRKKKKMQTLRVLGFRRTCTYASGCLGCALLVVYIYWHLLQICIRARGLEEMMTTITGDRPRWIIY